MNSGKPSNRERDFNHQGSLEIHIEELVLHGFRPANCRGIGDTLTAELIRLLTEQGLPRSMSQGGEISRLNGIRFEVNPGSGAVEIGAQLAQALYGGLKSWVPGQ